MTENIDDFECESKSFNFVLSDFEGPLDLLFRLVKEKGLDILTLKISEITDQYLEIVKDAEQLDFDLASEFITMAASLLEIKSRMMLPKLEEAPIDEEDEEATILQKLKEYALFKEQNDKLKSIETKNRFYVEPMYTDDDARLCIVDFDLTKLIGAYATLLMRFDNVSAAFIEKKIEKDRFTVADKIEFVSRLLKDRRAVKFSDLFEEDYTKSEMINTFLAILELLKRQLAKANQDDWGGDILIEYVDFDEEVFARELDELRLEQLEELANGKS